MLKAQILSRGRIPYVVWGTSNGDFETTKIGNVDMKFTEFSRIKIFTIESDIIVLDKNAPNPAFGMILGTETETLRNFTAGLPILRTHTKN